MGKCRILLAQKHFSGQLFCINDSSVQTSYMYKFPTFPQLHKFRPHTIPSIRGTNIHAPKDIIEGGAQHHTFGFLNFQLSKERRPLILLSNYEHSIAEWASYEYFTYPHILNNTLYTTFVPHTAHSEITLQAFVSDLEIYYSCLNENVVRGFFVSYRFRAWKLDTKFFSLGLGFQAVPLYLYHWAFFIILVATGKVFIPR